MKRWIPAMILLAACAAEPAPPTSLPESATRPLPAPAIEPGGDALQELSWLVGSWAGETDGVLTEEHWTVARGGSMLAVNRVSDADATHFFEFLRIEAREDGSVVYVAQPKGRAATEFARTESDGGRVTFANPEHDFPQTITYELVSRDRLYVTIAGLRDGKPVMSGWSWSRVR